MATKKNKAKTVMMLTEDALHMKGKLVIRHATLLSKLDRLIELFTQDEFDLGDVADKTIQTIAVTPTGDLILEFSGTQLLNPRD